MWLAQAFPRPTSSGLVELLKIFGCQVHVCLHVRSFYREPDEHTFEIGDDALFRDALHTCQQQ